MYYLPPYTVKDVFMTASQAVGWGLSLYDIPSIWPKTKGKDVRIAVLDTGVYSHVDLFNVSEINFTAEGAGDRTHGTHCTGIIAARDNNVGIVGTAPEAQCVVYKVLEGYGGGSLEVICKGISFAIKEKFDIISMSFGSFKDEKDLHELLIEANDKNIICVASAGNEGDGEDNINYPAKYNECISVGSTNCNGRISDFSSRGKHINISCPGEEILSTWKDNSYAILSGSSMAVPFCVGVLALAINNRMLYNKPKLNNIDAINILQTTAINPILPTPSPAYGWGVLNPLKFIEEYTKA